MLFQQVIRATAKIRDTPVMGQTCLRCRPKYCENTESGTIEICDYGVAFYNNNGQILKKEKRLTLQHISQNLRHELNKILQRETDAVKKKIAGLDSQLGGHLNGIDSKIDEELKKATGLSLTPSKDDSPVKLPSLDSLFK